MNAQTPAPADAPARTLVGAQTAARREDRPTRWRFPSGWPLLAVLIVQALLTLRLVRADTAYQDEALYLWAGHLQWANWLHGTAIPPFPYYFSGAPVIYPPLGALASRVGGLTGARVLSLVFMLAATTLLWSAARRHYGRRAAFFAAALFAVLGPTLHLGAFATYDALSLLLVALAAWCVLRVGDRGEVPGRMIAAGAALALANATSYSTILFDVLVPVLAVLAAVPAVGARVALRRVAILLTTVIALLAAGLLIGGSSYLTGFKRTILTPVAHTSSPVSVLSSSWYWAGVLVVLAVGAVVISGVRREGRAQTWLLAVLAAAAILGPAEQAWLHTAALLNEHVGVGAWFAAIAAGYAADRFIGAAPAGRQQAFTSATCVIALVFPVYLGAAQSWSFATSWPNATAFIAVFRPLAARARAPLVEDPRSPSTTCRPAWTGGAGPVPGPRPAVWGQHREPGHRLGHRRGGRRGPSRSTSPRVTFPMWPSTSPTPPRWTTAWPRGCTATPTTTPSRSCPTASSQPLGQGPTSSGNTSRGADPAPSARGRVPFKGQGAQAYCGSVEAHPPPPAPSPTRPVQPRAGLSRAGRGHGLAHRPEQLRGPWHLGS